MKTLAVLGYFDNHVSEIIKKIKKQIYEYHGLKTESLLDIPHITFTISESEDLEVTEKIVSEFIKNEILPSISFSYFGLFKEKRTLFLGITPTIELLQFQKKVYEAISNAKEPVSPLYTPSRWIPHSFLAENFNCFSDIMSVKNEEIFLKHLEIVKLSVTEYDHNLGKMIHRSDFFHGKHSH